MFSPLSSVSCPWFLVFGFLSFASCPLPLALGVVSSASCPLFLTLCFSSLVSCPLSLVLSFLSLFFVLVCIARRPNNFLSSDSGGSCTQPKNLNLRYEFVNGIARNSSARVLHGQHRHTMPPMECVLPLRFWRLFWGRRARLQFGCFRGLGSRKSLRNSCTLGSNFLLRNFLS